MSPGGWSNPFANAERAEVLSSSGLYVTPACSHFSLLRIMSSMVLIGTRSRNRCSPQICVAIILKCWLQEAGSRKLFIYTPRSQFVIEGS